MTAHPFTALRAEYEGYVAAVRPRPECVVAIEQVVRRLTKLESLGKYATVEAKIGVPQVVQATICEREDGNDFTKNPAQGDPWNRISTHVPKGRGPFQSWIEAAIDAFTVCDHLNDNSAPWSLAYACWKWEGYNGFGYRAHGRRSPYVVGGTNLQQPGKYVADGNFDPNHMDTQLGCLPVAMKMIELVPSLAFGAAIAIAAGPPIIPAVTPLPIGVGGSLTGAKWVQAMLNLIVQPDPLLAVDGSYGRRTRAAVRDAQVLFGLPPTGLVDNALCKAIDERIAAMRPAA